MEHTAIELEFESNPIDDNYRVIVAHSVFNEDTHDQKLLRDSHYLQIALSSNTNLWLDSQHLARHHEHMFCV